MTLVRDAARPLLGKRIAFLFGPGNIAVDYASSLVRGPERALLELGASVHTLNYALLKDDILGFQETRPDPRRDRYPDNSPFVRAGSALLEEGGPFDLTIGLFYDSCLADRLVEALRKHGGRLINYPLNLLDQPAHFTRCLELFDETWCAEEEALPSLGSKGRYVPMASDPWIFRPVGVPREPRLLFVGSAYGARREMLARCSEVLETTVAGARFDAVSALRGLARTMVRERRLPSRHALFRGQPPIGDEAYVRLAATHGVSAGFADVVREGTGELLHKVRLREYDATMTGLCHLAFRLPELERHFEDGKEILLYRSQDELPPLLARIARGSIDWRAIGAAARKRSVRDHTWTRRFSAALG